LVLLTSCIEGPIAGTPTLSIGIDPTLVGYEVSEVFLGQKADAYTPNAPLTADGEWDVSVDAANSDVLFKTRLVVVRPKLASAFNGTVIVEWLNVTGGADLPVEWLSAHREIVRSGAAWVGVSAQAVGVNQLKAAAPARYGSLNHPGDSYSYDIFTNAAQSIRVNPQATGGLKPKRIIGTGQSQSAGRLVTYINAVQPIAKAFDGFLVHSRGAGGASLSQSPLTPVPAPNPLQIRGDQTTPVVVVQAEDDVIRSNTLARQPDSSTYRLWELAGTAHLDTYTSRIGAGDYGNGPSRMLAEMRNPRPAPAGCAASQNAGGLHWTLQAAFSKLDAWIRTGTPPATGARLQTVSTSPTVLERDGVGNALGGVRSPQVDAPVARIDGINSGTGFCGLFGSTAALTTAQLQARYASSAAFVAEWNASADALVASGFLLPADAAELKASVVGISLF